MNNQPEPAADPLLEALAEAAMTHASNGAGAVDYPKFAAAVARMLAEMIAPQELPVQQQMIRDFGESLRRMVTGVALRASVVDGGKAN
ncbi:MAG: hypothetical protein AB7J28_15825 [Hyphomonadaceae bacterium]